MGLSLISCGRNVIVSSESTVAQRGEEHLGRGILGSVGWRQKVMF